MQLFERGFLFTYASVFAGGVLTSLTPCVYPLITITVSIFGARDETTSRAKAIFLGLMYVAGICSMYTALGVFSALAGKQFGAFLANQYVIVPVAVLMLLMAASMFGAFEIRLPTGLATRLQGVSGRGPGAAFLMGMVGGIIAAPCTGPVLASVLAYVAKEGSVGIGASLLFTYALGLGLLFFLVAAFAMSLPRPGAWMEKVKTIFGVIITVCALYFLRPVVSVLTKYASASLVWLAAHLAAVAVGVMFFLILRRLEKRGDLSDAARRALTAAGSIAMIVGLYGSLSWALTPRVDPATAAVNVWRHGAVATEQAAATAKRPMLLDFYADWCLPCKELDVKTFSKPEIQKELQRFALGKVDCTNDDNAETVAAQKQYGAETLPTVILMSSDGKTTKKITTFVTAEELLPLLQAIQ